MSKFARTAPPVRVESDVVLFGLGMHTSSSDIAAPVGSSSFCLNYEPRVNGGLDSQGGIEVFSGVPEPNLAAYQSLTFATPHATLVPGQFLIGQTSGAQGIIIKADAGTVAFVTGVIGAYQVGESVMSTGGELIAVADLNAADVTADLDNELAALSAAVARPLVNKVPGSGPIRGVAMLGATVFAWRDDAAGASLGVFRSTLGGWSQLTMPTVIPFNAGSSEWAEGSVVTQGPNTYTVRRVVLESGAWGAGTAAGRLILSGVSGVIAPGAIGGGGAATATAASAQITLLPGGRVRTDIGNFSARIDNRRLYGCDGVNPEFELDESGVYATVNTGTTARALSVKAHKNHLILGYLGSVATSSLNNPYTFAALTGASELGTSDRVVDFVTVGGSQDSGALMVICDDSLHVLYGNNSTDWNLVGLSRVSGGQMACAQDAKGAITLDAPGIVRYPHTQAFGNFATDVISHHVSSEAAGFKGNASVFLPHLGRYRVFGADGKNLTGLVVGSKRAEWGTFNYGRIIVAAISGELAGVTRTFVGDDQGWIYETDVGRSFAGDPIRYAVRPNTLFQKSPTAAKQYRGLELEVKPQSACAIGTSAEFVDGEELLDDQPEIQSAHAGRALRWDLSNWDYSFWGAGGMTRRRVSIEGQGIGITPMFTGESDKQLPHTLSSVILNYSLLRGARFIT